MNINCQPKNLFKHPDRGFAIFKVLLASLAILLSPLSFRTAHANSWTEAIENVEALHNRYALELKKRTGSMAIGTGYNGIDASMHRCAIVGRMLGLKGRVAQFEPPLPEMSDPGDEGVAYAIGSLDAWLTQANKLCGLPRSAKAKIWNLECATQVGLSDTYFEDVELVARNEFYELSDDRETLVILGAISLGFYDRFVAALEKNPQAKIVALGSPGGAVVEAVKVGYLVRSRGLETTQFGDCYSACPIVFLGGQKRTVWDQTRAMGFHEVSVDGEAVGHDDPVYSLLYRYISDMGANPQQIISWMWSAPPNQMTIKQRDVLCESGVATFVYHSCW